MGWINESNRFDGRPFKDSRHGGAETRAVDLIITGVGVFHAVSWDLNRFWGIIAQGVVTSAHTGSDIHTPTVALVI